MEISVPYVNTHDNLADFFTKPQDKNTFIAMRDIIMKTSASRILVLGLAHQTTMGR